VRLVGRQREVDRLHEFLATARRGPAALVIEGDAGIGKTALLDVAVADAGALRLLLARCVPSESTLAYAGLVDLLGDQTAAALPVLPPPQRRALEVALLHADAGPEAVEPHAVARATVEVLRHLAETAPILLAVDDVHWLDAPSARVLGFALRRLESVPVSLLATRRGTGEPLPLDLEGTPAGGRCARLALGPLAAADAEAMLAERLGRGLPRRQLTRLLAVADGNPLYAIELAAAPSAADPGDGLAPLPPRLEELLADRIGQLPAAAYEPLAAVASLAAPTVSLICAALGDGARAGLDHALDADVLRIDNGRLRFSHPLLGMAAQTRLAPSVRRALHRRLAALAADPEERARHLVQAADGPDADLAAEIERGADQARTRGAPEAAAELADAAVRLTLSDRPQDLCRRLIAAGYDWFTAGEAGRARKRLAAALDGTPAGPFRTELSWRLGMLCHLDGDTAEAVALLEAALDEAGDPAMRATIARKLAGLYSWNGRLGDSVRHAEAALSWAETAGDPRVLVESLLAYAMTMDYTGDGPPLPMLARIAELARATGPYAAHEDPEMFLAVTAMLRGDLDTARAGLAHVRGRAEEQGDEMGIASTMGYLAGCELAAGRWSVARQLADEALHRSRTIRIALAVLLAAYTAAMVHAYLGEVDTARALATELVDTGVRKGLAMVEAWGRSVLGFLAVSLGDARAAHAQLGPLLRRLGEIGFQEPSALYLPWSDLDALVELGELDEAEALAAEIQRLGEARDHPTTLAVAARGRGLVLAARGDIARAEEELTRAVRETTRLGWEFERGRALLALGTTLRRDKRKRAAREALDGARYAFDRLGAPLWAAKATAELGRIGGRQPGAGTLTATEARVARLAADGCTNREVANRLFLSTKTVAAHLTSVYAKLGVRSRTELSRHLRDHPLP
jgi:DNA-binding CsgD family transcriptional regulator